MPELIRMEGKERKTFGVRYEKEFPESTTMMPSRSYFNSLGAYFVMCFRKGYLLILHYVTIPLLRGKEVFHGIH